MLRKGGTSVQSDTTASTWESSLTHTQPVLLLLVPSSTVRLPPQEPWPPDKLLVSRDPHCPQHRHRLLSGTSLPPRGSCGCGSVEAEPCSRRCLSGLRARLLAEGQGSCSGMPPHHILCGHPRPPSFEPSLGVPADAQGAVFTWVPSGGLTLSPRSPPRGLLWPHRPGLASLANCQHGSRTLPAAEGPGGDHSLLGCHLGQGLSRVAVSP